MPDAYKNARLAPTDLGSGRALAPGEAVLADELDLNEGSHDSLLIADGLLVEAAIEPDGSLSGDELRRRARELGVPGRGSMSADELREAVALAEAGGGDTTTEEGAA